MSVQTLPRPPLDDPQQRLLWILPAAIVVWIFMLSGFALLLGERSAPPPPPALDAQIIVLPPPVPVGLQAGPLATTPKPALVKPAPAHHEISHVRKSAPARPTIATPKVALPPEPAAGANAGGAASGPANPPEGAGIGSASSSGEEGGGGGGTGPGTDSSGARAIFAPTPVIPDDLREDALEAVAVARFTISSDGTVKVALIKPTNNPRINQLLLDTLAKWQFFPAVRGGDPIDSTVDIRIPISVH
jgi:periplasmic protein TonB